MKNLLLLAMAVVLVGCGGDGTDGTMECNYCKEDIKRRALVCKHCRRENSYGIQLEASRREGEMTRRQKLLHFVDQDTHEAKEKYRRGEISESKYGIIVSVNNREKQKIRNNPEYDSDEDINEGIKKKKDEPINWMDTICTVLCVGACLAIFILAFVGLPKSQNPTLNFLLHGSPPDEEQKGMEQKLLEKAQKTQSYGKEWIECRNCGEAFDSRNDLFKHLKECPFGEEAESNPTEAESEYVVGAKKPVNAPAPPPQTNPAAKPTIVVCLHCGSDLGRKGARTCATCGRHQAPN